MRSSQCGSSISPARWRQERASLEVVDGGHLPRQPRLQPPSPPLRPRGAASPGPWRPLDPTTKRPIAQSTSPPPRAGPVERLLPAGNRNECTTDCTPPRRQQQQQQQPEAAPSPVGVRRRRPAPRPFGPPREPLQRAGRAGGRCAGAWRREFWWGWAVSRGWRGGRRADRRAGRTGGGGSSATQQCCARRLLGKCGARALRNATSLLYCVYHVTFDPVAAG